MAYPEARAEAYKPEAIRNSFAGAGLVSLNAEGVLWKLNISLRTTTLPSSRPGINQKLSKQCPTKVTNLGYLTLQPPTLLMSNMAKLLRTYPNGYNVDFATGNTEPDNSTERS